MGVVADLLSSVDAQVASFIFDGYDAVVAVLDVPLRLIIVIYFALTGYLMWLGSIELSLTQLLRRILLVSFVYVLATNSTYFSSLVVETFTDGPAKVAAAVVNGASSYSTNDLNENIDLLWEKCFESASKIAEQANWYDVGAYLLCAAIMLVGVMMCGYAAFLIALSKIALAVLLVLTPLFVVFVMFGNTRRIFEGWLSQVINFALIPVLVYTTLALIITIADQAANDVMLAAGSGTAELTNVAPFFLTGFVTIMLLFQVMGIAGGIAGGMSLSTLGMVGRTLARANPLAYASQYRDWNQRRKQRFLTDQNYKNARERTRTARTLGAGRTGGPRP